MPFLRSDCRAGQDRKAIVPWYKRPSCSAVGRAARCPDCRFDTFVQYRNRVHSSILVSINVDGWAALNDGDRTRIPAAHPRMLRF